LVAVLLLIGCTASQEPAPATAESPTQPSSPTSTQTAAPPATQTAAPPPAQPPQQKEIEIRRVTAANPVVIEGLARTFENQVAIRIRDARGLLLVETFTTSRGEIGHHNPFTATVFLTRDPGRRITVEALEYSAKDGSERSLDARSADFNVELLSAELWLPESNPSDCRRVAAVRRTMPKSISMARLLVEALIADPRSPFPKGSAVRSINIRDGVLTVDFNERLQNVGGACAAQAIRASVEATLKRLPAVREVVIAAAGSRELALQP
jgi:hypothetical protein